MKEEEPVDGKKSEDDGIEKENLAILEKIRKNQRQDHLNVSNNWTLKVEYQSWLNNLDVFTHPFCITHCPHFHIFKPLCILILFSILIIETFSLSFVWTRAAPLIKIY